MASTVTSLHQSATDSSPQTEQQRRYRDRLLELTLRPQKEISRTVLRVLRATAVALEGASVGYWRCANDGTALVCEMALDGSSGRPLRRRDKPGTRLAVADLPHWDLFLRERQTLVITNPVIEGGDSWPLSEARSIALSAVLSEGALHGVLRETTVGGVGYHLFPLYHPASIIYNPSLKETCQRDLALFSACVENIL